MVIWPGGAMNNKGLIDIFDIFNTNSALENAEPIK